MQDALASLGRSVTSGTWVVAGPFETERVILEPLGPPSPAADPRTTTPCGQVGRDVDAPDDEARPLSADFAFANGSPVTSGTAIGFAPRETLIVTVEPLTTLSPAAGCWAVTVSCCAPE